MHYTDPKPIWATEMVILFSLGFLTASLLWIGVWFFSLQPQYQAALDEKTAEVAKCATERSEVEVQLEQVRGAGETSESKLGEITTRLGRCLRDKRNLEKLQAQTQSAANPE